MLKLVVMALVLIAAPAARAEVVASAPTGFEVRAEAEVSQSPERVWRDLQRIQRWWSSAHTYSGDASRLRLEARAGGCWCERWAAGSIEHARVVMVMESESARTLRAIGGLGPLQAMGANGVLTFTVAPASGGAEITMTYRVSGDAAAGLDQMAQGVNGVMMEQFGRLTRYTTSGSPD